MSNRPSTVSSDCGSCSGWAMIRHLERVTRANGEGLVLRLRVELAPRCGDATSETCCHDRSGGVCAAGRLTKLVSTELCGIESLSSRRGSLLNKRARTRGALIYPSRSQQPASDRPGDRGPGEGEVSDLGPPRRTPNWHTRANAPRRPRPVPTYAPSTRRFSGGSHQRFQQRWISSAVPAKHGRA